MDKVYVINEGTGKSIVTDIVTYGGFFINYHFLGNSDFIKVFIGVIFVMGLYGKVAMAKTMTPKEAVEYFLSNNAVTPSAQGEDATQENHKNCKQAA